jgi:carbonic anhydrase
MRLVHFAFCLLVTQVQAFPLSNGNGRTIDKNIDDIIWQNKEWVNSKEAKDPDYFKKLGSGHSPKYMWIGCADARVPANEIMGEDAGSVFVVRNVANMVVNTDFNLMSALKYAVDYLKIPHIIVCGHYDCGGVRASTQRKDHVPPLENWLRNIRDVYRLHKDELDAIRDPEARHRRLVELNVIEQSLNLFKTGVIQRRRVETFKSGQEYTTPRIHACVFDPKTGVLERLSVSFCCPLLSFLAYRLNLSSPGKLQRIHKWPQQHLRSLFC